MEVLKINFSKEANLIWFTCIFSVPRERINPPNDKSTSNANEPNVLATTMFLPVTAINRNNAEAIWLTPKSSAYCLKNLQHENHHINYLDKEIM